MVESKALRAASAESGALSRQASNEIQASEQPVRASHGALPPPPPMRCEDESRGASVYLEKMGSSHSHPIPDSSLAVWTMSGHHSYHIPNILTCEPLLDNQPQGEICICVKIVEYF